MFLLKIFKFMVIKLRGARNRSSNFQINKEFAMNRGLKEALDMLVKKNIDRHVMLEEIRNSLESACRNYFNRNYEKVPVDRRAKK